MPSWRLLTEAAWRGTLPGRGRGRGRVTSTPTTTSSGSSTIWGRQYLLSQYNVFRSNTIIFFSKLNASMYILITFLCAYLIFCNTQLFIACCGQWKIVIFVWTIKISVVLAETGAGAATCSRSQQILSLLSVTLLTYAALSVVYLHFSSGGR